MAAAAQGKPTVFCLGTNHRSLELEDRERFHIPQEELKRFVPELASSHHLAEVCILSTCNRFEVFGVTAQSLTKERLIEFLVALQREHRQHLPLTEELIRQSVYVYFEEQAVNHIFNVASGLDSLILGETQITGQFKDALAFAKDCQTLGPILGRLSQDALATVKKVRTNTDIGKRPVSISHAAIDLANRMYGAIRDHHVLIIGAGEMSQVAAKYAAKYQPKQLSICNRSVSRAEDLVNALGMGQAYGLTELPDLLSQADIIISATAAEGYVLHQEQVRKALVRKRGRSLFIVDIALPRDVEPQTGDLDNVYLFDIDDLKQVVDEHFEERRIAAEKAQIYVVDGTKTFLRWLETIAIKPTLSHFRTYVEELCQRELEKTLGRDTWKSISPDQKQQLTTMLQSVANKIVADAGSNMKTPPEGVGSEELAGALAHLFPLIAKKELS